MLSTKFKVCIFGDAGVGKTTLVNRYLTGLFDTNFKITIGADFYLKKLVIDCKEVTLQIWDFAGEDKFRFLLPSYVAGSGGGIFMYDITRTSSIQSCKSWLGVFKKSFENNKIDIPFAMGHGGQRIAIMPNMNAVMVTQAEPNPKPPSSSFKRHRAIDSLLFEDFAYFLLDGS